jgi:regulatory protein RepA
MARKGVIGWGDAIQVGKVPDLVDEKWVEPGALPLPAGDWREADLAKLLPALFQPDEHVQICTAFREDAKRGKIPGCSHHNWTCRELLDALERRGVDDVLEPNGEAGAWIGINPVDGEGCKDNNVTAFRHTLVQVDDGDLERQLCLINELELPCTAIIHSGRRSLHALVRVDAANLVDYRARVDYLHAVCKRNGLDVESSHRGPARLCRMPGVMRGEAAQYVVEWKTGRPDYDQWRDWAENAKDDLPDPENLGDVWDTPPALAPELIEGILRQGHKLLMSGGSKSAKSFDLQQLAVAVAEGREWHGWKCKKSKVLYVNLEIDRASCIHRLKEIYRALGWEPLGIHGIEVWNLRGKSRSMDRLAPKIIRRAEDRGFGLIVVDPLYKVLTGSENEASEMAAFFNYFDQIAERLGAACVYSHHHSKGAQGQKSAGDRASGSGVFYRDPDALIDFVELKIPKARREVLVSDIRIEAMRAAARSLRVYLLGDMPPGTEDCADAFLSYLQGLAPAHAVAFAQAYYEGGLRANRMIGLRIECGLREFAKPEPRTCWFDYPIHIEDRWELLKDAKAEGEEPPWAENQRSKDALNKERQKENNEATVRAIESCGGAGKATINDVAEVLFLTPQQTRTRIKWLKGFVTEKSVILTRKAPSGK